MDYLKEIEDFCELHGYDPERMLERFCIMTENEDNDKMIEWQLNVIKINILSELGKL